MYSRCTAGARTSTSLNVHFARQNNYCIARGDAVAVRLRPSLYVALWSNLIQTNLIPKFVLPSTLIVAWFYVSKLMGRIMVEFISQPECNIPGQRYN